MTSRAWSFHLDTDIPQFSWAHVAWPRSTRYGACVCVEDPERKVPVLKGYCEMARTVKAPRMLANGATFVRRTLATREDARTEIMQPAERVLAGPWEHGSWEDAPARSTKASATAAEDAHSRIKSMWTKWRAVAAECAQVQQDRDQEGTSGQPGQPATDVHLACLVDEQASANAMRMLASDGVNIFTSTEASTSKQAPPTSAPEQKLEDRSSSGNELIELPKRSVIEMIEMINVLLAYNTYMRQLIMDASWRDV